MKKLILLGILLSRGADVDKAKVLFELYDVDGNLGLELGVIV